MQAKLEGLLSEVDHTKWPIDIGTYNLNLLKPEKAKEALTEYRQKLKERIKCYHDLHKFLKDSGCPAYRFEVAVRRIYLFEAEPKWLDYFLKEAFKNEYATNQN